jgi:hypothetical protein
MVVAALTCASSTAALAAPPVREQARDKLAEGVRLLSAHDYARALVQFDGAYALFPSPKLHYNRGLALEGLGRQADAFVAFSRFVDESKDPSPDYLKHAQRELERLKGMIGFLEISTSPTGAEVRLDGERLGTTPLSPVPTEAGKHEVTVSAPDFGPDSVQQVVVSRGERLSVRVDLRGRQTSPPRVTNPGRAGGSASPEKPESLPMPTAPGRPDQPGPSPADTSRGPVLRVVAWSSAAVGAALLTGGLVETVVASNKLDQFRGTLAPDGSGRTCGVDRPGYGGGVCTTLHDDWKQARTLGIVGLVGGGVLAATSVALFVVSSDQSGERKVACAPAATSFGLTCAGRF